MANFLKATFIFKSRQDYGGKATESWWFPEGIPGPQMGEKAITELARARAKLLGQNSLIQVARVALFDATSYPFRRLAVASYDNDGLGWNGLWVQPQIVDAMKQAGLRTADSKIVITYANGKETKGSLAFPPFCFTRDELVDDWPDYDAMVQQAIPIAKNYERTLLRYGAMHLIRDPAQPIFPIIGVAPGDPATRTLPKIILPAAAAAALTPPGGARPYVVQVYGRRVRRGQAGYRDKELNGVRTINSLKYPDSNGNTELTLSCTFGVLPDPCRSGGWVQRVVRTFAPISGWKFAAHGKPHRSTGRSLARA